ncbi:hydrogenase formation protein HypD [Candidatus Bathyarchaeota archaeon]|nr:hydrogenase formation protein HypD [Candidatus Bathyarchaeota archaeon]MBS7618476.1 hydrogenase formation protein HypD [Candidatus Bathyarchaeota archaeon]
MYIENLYRRNRRFAEEVKRLIHKYVDRLVKIHGRDYKVKFMNFCGTHEWTTVHYGIRSLLPENIELVAGPGCPVCVTPSFLIEHAIKLSFEDVRVYTFGDAFKLPTVKPVKGVRNLAEAKASGGNVAVVYSFLDALKDLYSYAKESIFLAIGFETTAPGYAIPLINHLIPKNMYFLSALRLTPPAAEYAIMEAKKRSMPSIDGIIAPGHVSAITGAKPWDELSRKLGMPAVISGFEPLDILLSILELLKMVLKGEVGVKIEYRRVVSWNGNVESLNAINIVFEVVDSPWRGIGFIDKSGLEIKNAYSNYDSFKIFSLNKPTRVSWHDDSFSGCKCTEVVLGLAKPTDCRFFLKGCNPSKPLGPCMVSSEGTCSIWARFGGYLNLKKLGD